MAIANPKPSPIPQEWGWAVPEKAEGRTRYECACGAWCDVERGALPAFIDIHEEHEDTWLN